MCIIFFVFFQVKTMGSSERFLGFLFFGPSVSLMGVRAVIIIVCASFTNSEEVLARKYIFSWLY